MSNQVLIVDDDRFLLENLSKLLHREGWGVKTATSGEDALQAIVQGKFDLLVLDVGLPGIDGISTCRQLRKTSNIPVIMLTARSDTMDKVIGLEVGADDYLTKPFEPSELLARVRAQLRRSKEYQSDAQKSGSLTIGEWTIDFEQRTLTVSGKIAQLTQKEFDLVAYLAQNCGRAIGRETLFETIWGYDMDFNSNSLDVYIYRIRKKLERDPNDPEYIMTMRGYGYKMVSPGGGG